MAALWVGSDIASRGILAHSVEEAVFRTWWDYTRDMAMVTQILIGRNKGWDKNSRKKISH